MWYQDQAAELSVDWINKAEQYQLSLTKPPGALGALESVAVKLSAMQETVKPQVENIAIAIMAGDHGIADEGVSAFPQAVTGQMVSNFAQGGAAISVLAKHLNADLQVYNTGTVDELPEMANVHDMRISSGTKNMMQQPAMTQQECEQALSIGKQAVERAVSNQAQLFIGGEMGIANTTSAACLAARLLSCSATEIVGPGTGLDDTGVNKKAQVIEQVLAKYNVTGPLEILSTFGGFEIAALVGSFIAAAQQKLPILVDGYIATAAALVAVRINPSVQSWLIASHQSAEPAHHKMLAALSLVPLLQLDMRLGEGSGAAVAVPILQAACRLQAEMASFAEAGVSEA